MNLEALYGPSVTPSLSRAGALALGLVSIAALPGAVSPMDTQKQIKATQAAHKSAAGGLNSPWIFIVIGILILWAIGRK